MPKYDVTFTRGEYTREKVRYVVEANDSDEAMKKAYCMREAKYYDNVWVSKRKEGLASYMCEIEVQMFWDGKRDTAKWPMYERFEATSEYDAERQARDKFIGKYYAGVDYNEKKELLNAPCPEGQSMYCARITDSYQI